MEATAPAVQYISIKNRLGSPVMAAVQPVERPLVMVLPKPVIESHIAVAIPPGAPVIEFQG
jgi:hypothetical protein